MFTLFGGSTSHAKAEVERDPAGLQRMSDDEEAAAEEPEAVVTVTEDEALESINPLTADEDKLIARTATDWALLTPAVRKNMENYDDMR